MTKLLSLAALVAGIVLIYMGYQRQESLTGKAAESLSKIGQRIDGGDHMTRQVEFYAAGTVLVIGGAIGLGVIRR